MLWQFFKEFNKMRGSFTLNATGELFKAYFSAENSNFKHLLSIHPQTLWQMWKFTKAKLFRCRDKLINWVSFKTRRLLWFQQKLWDLTAIAFFQLQSKAVDDLVQRILLNLHFLLFNISSDFVERIHLLAFYLWHYKVLIDTNTDKLSDRDLLACENVNLINLHDIHEKIFLRNSLKNLCSRIFCWFYFWKIVANGFWRFKFKFDCYDCHITSSKFRSFNLNKKQLFSTC